MNKGQFGCEPFVLLACAYMVTQRGRAGMEKRCTANAGEQAEMRLSAAICTANIAGVADGEWALISPYGDHASPDGSYTQRFSREQAEKVVKTWNSITGTAARVFKNVMHGLGPKFSTPVWEGHPETDKQRWPKEKLLAEITDVRTGNDGLEGRVTWNAKGTAKRATGALYPSPLWWHWPPSGEPPSVFPELLESIGLVATPNIASVPAWTANAPFPGTPPDENQNQNAMNPEQLKALARALNLPESTDPATIISTAQNAYQLSTANAAKITEQDTALQTANTAKAELENKLTTANGQVTALTTERDNLTTANAALTTEVGALRKGLLDLAEKKGAITAAERKNFETRISTANTAADAITELQTRKAVNVQAIELNGNRIDLSTANSRATALQNVVQKRMKDDQIGYDEAFAKCQADPQLKTLWDAMQPATA